MKSFVLKSRGRLLNLDDSVIMGILNVTPDSFSDGGQFDEIESAVKRAKEMIDHGAMIIDIGGESTGPGSVDVSLEEETRRVIPVVRAIREFDKDVWISIDTYKSELASEAIEAGADLINDITACRVDAKMAGLIAESEVPIVIMYSKDPDARTTKTETQYDDVIATIKAFFEQRIAVLHKAGVLDEQIILDPGMGAFVSALPEYSFEIIERLGELTGLGYPLLLGPSRKSFLGGAVEDRLQPSLDIALKCMENGASILRMHDVKEMKELMPV